MEAPQALIEPDQRRGPSNIRGLGSPCNVDNTRRRAKRRKKASEKPGGRSTTVGTVWACGPAPGCSRRAGGSGIAWQHCRLPGRVPTPRGRISIHRVEALARIRRSRFPVRTSWPFGPASSHSSKRTTHHGIDRHGNGVGKHLPGPGLRALPKDGATGIKQPRGTRLAASERGPSNPMFDPSCLEGEAASPNRDPSSSERDPSAPKSDPSTPTRNPF